jgi:hypothetical protein
VKSRKQNPCFLAIGLGKMNRANKILAFFAPRTRTDSDFRLAPENQIITGWRRKSDITRNLKI